MRKWFAPALGFLIVALSGSGLLAQSKPNSLTLKEVAEGWILLWDGETTFGWESRGEAEWKITDGILTASSGGNGWLANNASFGDFILKADFRTGADGNSGIFLRSSKEGQPHQTGYELQIFDAHKEYTTGSLVNHLKAKKARIVPNQWHSYEVRAEGGAFVVKLDGKTLLKGNDPTHTVGHIGLQYNKDKQIEFRNLKLKPLGLRPIFNGRDLNGWRKVNSPDLSRGTPEWTVKQAMIHVERGPGQLETTNTFQNFVFQLDIRTHPRDNNHHPNSGIFFRGDRDGFWTGYESQIRNEFKGQDRAQPVDFGTGGIYHYQPARHVIPNDGEFFSKTIAASGRHMAVWVNGVQTSDYTDTRPEGRNARKEARLAAGTLSLQAHDPTTNLDFKNLSIVELPNR
ncbi:MAG: DUF1080 domain-containing protein [Acidimicrobiia bacterium]|nr:DUF1080 domain-containing protein [Acidimicrobiia bacterium]